jgi:hypothetical protein
MKIRKAVSIIICVSVLTASTVCAEIIPGLFNTGVNNSGERLPDGSMEQHYAVSGTASTAYVFYQTPPPPYYPYVQPADDALWIGPSDNYHAPSGEYIYTLTFDLAGLDHPNAIISGQWSSDNESTIFLNSVSTGFTIDALSFTSLHNFTISEGFLPGVNTLEFHVTNSDPTPWGENPTMLLVQNLQGEIVPEPGTICLLGLGGLVAMRRHRA